VDTFRLNWKTHRQDDGTTGANHGGPKPKPKKPGHGGHTHPRG
jgi:hypothetical protein